ncbi:hypothetical protein Y1Q_0002122 [Alligator mississippiensis]|uniref:Uncharacterized protein n=1 Tax=Alligator mississippiensis TaxID=8496 RepID=A0A151MPL8_ALLMI|nr:hypothetical protein Y1Q_0002122 [Alligator mississippiensis]
MLPFVEMGILKMTGLCCLSQSSSELPPSDSPGHPFLIAIQSIVFCHPPRKEGQLISTRREKVTGQPEVQHLEGQKKNE